MKKAFVFFVVLVAAVLVACDAEPKFVEVTRIVEVPSALTQIQEVEVTRLVESPTEIQVPVEVTRLVEVPVEVEVTRIVVEEVIIELPCEEGSESTNTSPMAFERHNHTASTLDDGRVLVAGGAVGSWQGPSITSTEIYDPDSNTWSAGPSLNSPRQDHMATALPDGRIFLTGGTLPGPIWQASTEMLDAEGRQWEMMAPLTYPRSMHSATLLNDGRVLVLGGWTGVVTLDHGEIYDPATDSWRQSGPMLEARHDHSATLLPDGRILIVGGYREQGGDQWLETAEIYDPASGLSIPTDPIYCHGTSHEAVRLADDRVLVVGGACGSGRPGIVARSEIFDPRTNTWQATTPMTQARFGFTATRLSDGRILVVGGGEGVEPLASVEMFDPDTGRWTPFATLNVARAAHTTTLLVDDRLLIAGGWSGDELTLNSVELLNTSN